jgi:predicted GNAT family acetyltransferase
MTADPLIRPVWNCLRGRQSHLAIANGAAVRIDPGYGPFAAARDTSDEAQAALAEPWPTPPGTRVERTASLVQMVAESPMLPQPGDGEYVALSEDDAPEMAALAHATRPGPWGPLTHRYGQFYGLREGGRLVAMAGERMLPGAGLAELSGVCTLPEFRGAGLAARLIRRVMTAQQARGDTPCLHSYSANASANRLYEQLGFRTRREMVATVLMLT